MKRCRIAPRPDWKAKAEAVGFTYHALGDPSDEAGTGGSYWDETAYWEFTAAEVDTLEEATNELHRLCLEAVACVVRRCDLMDRFGIPHAFQPYVRASWERRDPHLYGRMDLAFDPDSADLHAPKLLEYNADTPTSVIETAVMQWFWLQDRFPGADQFNSLHERLIDRWRGIRERMRQGAPLHLSSWAESEEEFRTVQYLMDTAVQAGLRAEHLGIAEVGYDGRRRRFVDLDGKTIEYWFKLYPWEWLVHERFGPHLLDDRMGVVEPVWKMILSNKALLPLLWEMFPGHPNLLPAAWSPDALGADWIAKPVLGREGANMRLVLDGDEVARTGGSYADAPQIYQRAVRLPRRDGRFAVIGSWVVGDESAGMLVREDAKPIMTGDSKAVPHCFSPQPVLLQGGASTRGA